MKNLFIGGMIKSGTSLVRRLVGNHPETFSGLETYWFDLYNNYKLLGLPKGSLISGQVSITDEQRINMISDFYNLDVNLIINLYNEKSNALEFINSFFELAIKKNKKQAKIWVEKTPGNSLFFKQILDLGFNYLHVIRDPADVWYSCKRDKKFNTIDEFINIYEEYQKPLYQSKNPNIKLIVYKRLVENYEDVMYKVFEFLKLKMFKINVRANSDDGKELKIVRNITGKVSQTLLRLENPIDRNSIGVSKYIPTTELNKINKKLKSFSTEEIMKSHREIIL